MPSTSFPWWVGWVGGWGGWVGGVAGQWASRAGGLHSGRASKREPTSAGAARGRQPTYSHPPAPLLPRRPQLGMQAGARPRPRTHTPRPPTPSTPPHPSLHTQLGMLLGNACSGVAVGLATVLDELSSGARCARFADAVLAAKPPCACPSPACAPFPRPDCPPLSHTHVHMHTHTHMHAYTSWLCREGQGGGAAGDGSHPHGSHTRGGAARGQVRAGAFVRPALTAACVRGWARLGGWAWAGMRDGVRAGGL